MPLEIREIGISLRVGDQSSAIEAPPREQPPRTAAEDIVDECVRRVLQMLKNRQER